jgi:hypothetical protein
MKWLFKYIILIFTCCLFQNMYGKSKPDKLPHPVYCNPINLNYMVQHPNSTTNNTIFLREGADPSIAIFKGYYYLFSSVSNCYWQSANLTDWKSLKPLDLHTTLPILQNYAPTVVAMGDTLYLKDGNGKGFVYKTSTPEDPDSWKVIPGTNWHFPDAQFFLDDDERLWITYGCSSSGFISIQELNTLSFQVKGPSYTFFMPDKQNRGWERANSSARGNNDKEAHGWVEGSQLFKYNHRYYLIYSLPDLSNAYANGVYVSDSLTGPYHYQENNPVTQKLTGFAPGAGHGQVFLDKFGNCWTLTCQSIWGLDRFERRISLFPTVIDPDGIMHTDTYLGDYPTIAFQGKIPDYPVSQWAGMNLLTINKPVHASSSIPMHGPGLAIDEEINTWWSASTGKKGEWFSVDLLDTCDIEAIQINFSEQDLKNNKTDKAYMQYMVESSLDGKKWKPVIDKRNNKRDIPHDFVVLTKSIKASYIRIVNHYMPYGGLFALRGFRVFGKSKGELLPPPEFEVARDKTDPRQAIVYWNKVQDADGYIVRFGTEPGQLFHSYQVYDTNFCVVRSLDRGVDYYFTVDVFNGNGLSTGKTIVSAQTNKPGMGRSTIEKISK